MKSMWLKKFINLTLRFHAARHLYKLCSPLWNGFGTTPSYDDACRILNDFCPDTGRSPACPTKPLPKADYDLLIIVAAYNVAPYLAECLDSILSQQTDYRILVRVVNDASTDSTAEILNRYASNPAVEIITHSRNLGLSAARNSALANLNATYVCNVDADDKLAPGAISHWLKKAFDSDADIVATGLKRFDADTGQTISTISPADAEDVDVEHVEGLPNIFVYRREMFREVVYPVGYWFEDVIFELLFFPKAKKIASASGTYYLYRLRRGSITQSHKSKHNLGSLYGGAKSIICSVESGCWSSDRNRRFLSALCAYIIRITNARLISLPSMIRKSAMMYWQPVVRRIQPYLTDTEKTDSELFDAILAGDYSRFELNCITCHRWS